MRKGEGQAHHLLQAGILFIGVVSDVQHILPPLMQCAAVQHVRRVASAEEQLSGGSLHGHGLKEAPVRAPHHLRMKIFSTPMKTMDESAVK